jgi:hypothetical protein
MFSFVYKSIHKNKGADLFLFVQLFLSHNLKNQKQHELVYDSHSHPPTKNLTLKAFSSVPTGCLRAVVVVVVAMIMFKPLPSVTGVVTVVVGIVVNDETVTLTAVKRTVEAVVVNRVVLVTTVAVALGGVTDVLGVWSG